MYDHLRLYFFSTVITHHQLSPAYFTAAEFLCFQIKNRSSLKQEGLDLKRLLQYEEGYGCIGRKLRPVSEIRQTALIGLAGGMARQLSRKRFSLQSSDLWGGGGQGGEPESLSNCTDLWGGEKPH